MLHLGSGSEASASRRRVVRRLRESKRYSEPWRSLVTASAATAPGAGARCVSPRSRTVSGVSIRANCLGHADRKTPGGIHRPKLWTNYSQTHPNDLLLHPPHESAAQ
jgi:hypothetical protein